MQKEKSDWLGTLKFLGRDEDRNFIVRLEIVRSGPNRNGWNFENMEELSKTFLGTPILCAYVNGRVGDGHNFREKTLPTGETVPDFTGPTAERIVGMISEDPKDLWTEEREDGVWTVANGKIWRFYNRQLVDRLAMQGSMSVSAEIETFDGTTDENGVEVYRSWQGLGVTLLHESVPPAVPGANIRAIKAMNEQFKEMKFKAASYHFDSESDDGQDPPWDEEGEADTGAEKTLQTSKGGRTHMNFNKREAERLAPKFEGYTIVGLSEDSSNVVLMSETGALYSYRFSEEFGEEVVASAIVPVKEVSVLCGSSEEGLCADLDEIVRSLSESVAEEKRTVANLNGQLETVKADLAAAQEAVHRHRIDMVKEAIRATLAEIDGACGGNKELSVADEAAEMEAKAENYAGMEENGKFCGAEAARAELVNRFGEKQIASMKAEQEANRANYAWNGVRSGGAEEDGIAGLLSRING